MTMIQQRIWTNQSMRLCWSIVKIIINNNNWQERVNEGVTRWNHHVYLNRTHCVCRKIWVLENGDDSIMVHYYPILFILWTNFTDRELLSLTDPDDICHDFSDMLAPAISSAFSRLFVHHDNMQVYLGVCWKPHHYQAWNEFIDKTEDVQLHILDECDHRRRRQLVSTDGGYRVGGRSPAKHHRGGD
jgi:hypothetical protein